MVSEVLRERASGSEWREKWHGLTCKGVLSGVPVTLLLPQTFMNLSGKSVQACLADLKLKSSDVCVIHDELELPFAALRAKFGGGHAGHNGLRDITARVGAEFARVRVGIGRPLEGAVDAYVLSAFSRDESIELPSVLSGAADLVELIVRDGIDVAIERSNPPQKKSKSPPRKPTE
jgi:PTH1 family peptidyl-tRNA hydrolase